MMIRLKLTSIPLVFGAEGADLSGDRAVCRAHDRQVRVRLFPMRRELALPETERSCFT
jgi:hypothetical protein